MNNLHFGSYTINPRLRQLQRGEERLPLPAKAFDLLLFMSLNAGRPLSKTELLEAVWPDAFVEESNLSHNIFLLRKTLGASGEGAIVTLPGRGYQFAATVVETSAVAPVELSSSPLGAAHELEATRSRLVYEEITEERVGFWRSPLALGMTTLAVAAIAVAGWLGWQRYEDRVGGAPVQLVVADLDGTTGDATLDRTLTTITRSELAQSPFISLLPQSTVRATLLQMRRTAAEAVTVPLAREACERTGSQAVLHESIARAGSAYLLTEEATNCVDGSSLGITHQEAAAAQDIPHAIARANDVIRHALGESRRTIARFNAPLSSANTQSLEALKDYSQAGFFAGQGHFPEAIELDKQAIAIDPSFAAAYFDLSGYYMNTLSRVEAMAALQKSYDLRSTATEPAQLYITARYHNYITGDLFEALRNYRAWIDLYPRQVQPWSGLQNIYRMLGRTSEGLDAAQHVMKLAPANAVAWQSLADAQLKAGDFASARQTCNTALQLHFDTESTHYLLLRLAHLQHDPVQIAAEEAWSEAHPDSTIMLGNQVAFAFQAGRMREGLHLAEEMKTSFAHHGNAAAGIHIAQQLSETLIAFGYRDQGRAALMLTTPAPEVDELLALIDLGEPEQALKILQQQLVERPSDTLWNVYYQPLVRGYIELTAGHAQPAIKQFESMHAFDKADADPFYLRGLAYMKTRQFAQAEMEFRALLAHPEIEPDSYQLPLAQLQLARSLALSGDRTEAAAAYRTFLAGWANADADQPILLQAKRELATL
jgi:DNA-binding winged helix-turn-helix (wHTH) protein/tetratricopeptide (TPR) repeat protein